MGNEVEIRITSDNDSAPGLAAAQAGVKAVGDEATKASTKAKTFGDSVKGVGTEAKKTTTDVDGMRRGITNLTIKMDEAQGVVDSLRRKIAETGDLQLFGDLSKAEAQVSRLKRVRDNLISSLAQDGAEAGAGFGVSFSQRFGAVVVRAAPTALGAAGPPILAVAAPFAAGLAAMFGSAIAAGIAGQVGIGGVVGGFAIAAQHPELRAQADDLADDLGQMLKRSAVAFVPAGINGIKIFRREILLIEKDLTGIFSKSATFVEPLARAFGAATRRLVEGIGNLIDESGPVVDMLAEQIPRFADAAADGLELLSDNTESGARALGQFLIVVEGVIRALFYFINALSETYEWMEAIGGILTGNTGPLLRKFHEDAASASEGNDGLNKSLGEIMKGFEGATDAGKEYRDMIRAQTDPAFALIDAQADLKQAQDDYNEALKEHGRNSPEARDALVALARAAIVAQEAAQGAAGTFDGSLSPAMRATLKAAGLTEQEIKDLEKQFRLAKQAGDAFAKTYTANVVVRYREDGRAVPISNVIDPGIGGRAMGGLVGAASGGLRSNMVMLGEHGREIAELPPSTRVHSNPDTERMLAGVGGGRVQVEVSAARTASRDVMDAIVAGLRYRIDSEGGGNVQDYLGAGA